MERLRKSSHRTRRSSCVPSSQSRLFFTQTDAGYYAKSQANTDSQYLQANSLLDALENIGYYGFVTFIATVQRIGSMRAVQASAASYNTQLDTQGGCDTRLK